MIMSEWLDAVLFGVALVAFVLGVSSILLGVFSNKTGSERMQEKIEYGFFGVSGIVVCLVMGYALA